MGLKSFHVAFIFLSNLLSLGFGIWCVREAADSGDTTYKVLAVLSFLALAGLVTYGIWFLKKWKTLSYFVWAAALVGIGLAPAPAMACAVCQGNPNHPMVISANTGVVFMLAIITMVLMGFGALFLSWRKRERAWMKSSIR